MSIRWSRRPSTATAPIQPGARRGFPRQPDGIPVLSAGRHRSPRSGACFMEFASFLAGERWSDHPACTHPGLAQLARAVNDLTTDQGRSALAPLIPSVIGLTSDDPRRELLIAVTAVAAALPEASVDRQHALAVGGLVCADALAKAGGDDFGAGAALRRALEAAPEAEGWARRFLARNARWHDGEVTVRQTHATIAMAVDGIRSACADYPDQRLHALLASTIAVSERFVAAEARARAEFEAEALKAAAATTPSPVAGGPAAASRVGGDFARHV